jgi:Ca2+-binding RTX toxin-like protein
MGGIDTMDGRDGSDIYLIASAAEHPAAEITDTGISGTDEVRFAATSAGTLTLYAGDTGIEQVVIGTGTGTTAVTTATTALNVNASAVLNGLTLIGNAGANILTGTAYADTLMGGKGNDVLTGGNGADKFVFNTTPNASSNRDTITDFQSGTDVIQLSKTIFTALGGLGTLTSAQFWSAPGAVAGHDADDRIVYNPTTGALYYDADGNGSGAAVQIVLLGTNMHPVLADSDIQVIA